MCHLDLRTLTGHEGAVNCVAFSPGGGQVLSAGADGMIRVWETGTGRAVHMWKAHAGAITALAFHPDGQVLASGDDKDKVVKLWDVSTGNQQAGYQHEQIPGPAPSSISSLAFSADGRWLAVGMRGPKGTKTERKIWDLDTGKAIHSLVTDPPKEVYSVAFNGDATQLICAGAAEIEFWDLATGTLQTVLPAHGEVSSNNVRFRRITSVVCSPGGETFATCSQDQKIKLWDAETLEELATLRGHDNSVTQLAFSPDGKQLASSSVDRSIKLWNLETNEEIRTLKGHRDPVTHLSFSSDGTRIASTGSDGTVKIWDANTRMDERLFLNGGRGHHPLGTAQFSPDGTMLAVSCFTGIEEDAEYFVEVRNAETAKLYREFHGHNGVIHGVALNSDLSRLATAGEDHRLIIHDFVTGEVLHTLSIGSHNIIGFQLTFSLDGRFLLANCSQIDPEAGERVLLKAIYEVATGKLLQALSARGRPRETPYLPGATISPDSRSVAVATLGKSIRIVDPVSGAEMRSWEVDNVATHLSFSPNGEYLAGTLGRGGRVVVWDAKSGAEVVSVQGSRSVGFDASGSRLFTRGGVWHVDTGDLMCAASGIGRSYTPAATQFASQRGYTSVAILDVRSDTDQVRAQREAQALVAHVLRMPFQDSPPVTVRKADIVDRIGRMRTISEPVQKLALGLVEDLYTPVTESSQFAEAALETVLREATPLEYQQAVEWAKVAVDLAPPGDRWSAGDAAGALGLALYRTESYLEALSPLEEGYETIYQRDPRVAAIILPFIAMTHYQLGNTEETQKILKRLRDPEVHGRHLRNALVTAAYQEAVALIAGNAGPTSQ